MLFQSSSKPSLSFLVSVFLVSIFSFLLLACGGGDDGGSNNAINESPTINDDTFTVSEDAAVTTSVGSVTASDPDTGDTLTYSIIAGNTGNAFVIDSSTGEITANGALDYETLASYSLTVQVSDGTNTDTATITIDITDATPGEQIATSIAIGVSASSVPSDDSSSIEVTASLLDQNNVAVEDVMVSFSTSTGALSAASETTDTSGQAIVDFHSGLVDQSNRVATITATAGSLTAQVPVQISGSTVTVNQAKTTLIIGEAPDSLEIYVTNSAGTAIYNTPVTISVASSSTGNVTVTPASGNTDVEGTLDVAVSGANPGTVTLEIIAAGATASCQYMVDSSGSVLQITNPADPASMATNQSLTIVVSDPNPGSSDQVVLSTTLGTLTGGGGSGSAVTLPLSGGNQVQAVLTSNTAGIATVQAYDIDSPSITDSITVAMYSPESAATNISIQASNTVVAPSTVDLKNSVEITARVTDAGDAPVGQAPVVFTMSNTTGGGEKITPSIVLTNASGVAATTFTSGSISSGGEGVLITAYLLNNPSIVTNPPLSIVIGGTSGSVVIGVSTEIMSAFEGTAYQYYVSVLVADSNGNPVPGAEVTMNLWPAFYYTGDAWYGRSTYSGPYANEDVNRNLILDAGEDINSDGDLTPANSCAGNMPSVVTADADGVATFLWTYLKDYAGYIDAEIRASTYVLGSETTSATTRMLTASDEDYKNGSLNESPFTAP